MTVRPLAILLLAATAAAQQTQPEPERRHFTVSISWIDAAEQIRTYATLGVYPLAPGFAATASRGIGDVRNNLTGEFGTNVNDLGPEDSQPLRPRALAYGAGYQFGWGVKGFVGGITYLADTEGPNIKLRSWAWGVGVDLRVLRDAVGRF